MATKCGPKTPQSAIKNSIPSGRYDVTLVPYGDPVTSTDILSLKELFLTDRITESDNGQG